MFQASQYVDLAHTEHKDLFTDDEVTPIWVSIGRIAGYLEKYFANVQPDLEGVKLVGNVYIGERVVIGEGTVIEHGAMIKGPAVIGKNCVIQCGCYLRENVIVGNNVVLGNHCVLKNSVVFDEAQIPHFNYVGDSILGYKSHIGAGVILSNVKLDHTEIEVEFTDEAWKMQRVSSGLRKFGAILGDYAEVGCNSVLNPGSLVGRNSLIYPGTQWRGVLASSTIAKTKQTLTLLRRKERKK